MFLKIWEKGGMTTSGNFFTGELLWVTVPIEPVLAQPHIVVATANENSKYAVGLESPLGHGRNWERSYGSLH